MLMYERCIKGALQCLCFVQVEVFIFFVQSNNCIFFTAFAYVTLLYYQAEVEIYTITCKECARFLSTLNRLFLEYSSVQYNRSYIKPRNHVLIANEFRYMPEKLKLVNISNGNRYHGNE